MDKQPAIVERVVDGDTVEVRYQDNKLAKVRLIGVNTPESKNTFRKRKEPFGVEAKEFTKHTLYKGREVYIELDKDQTDMYGRTLAYLWLDNETMYNRLLIEEGLARVYTWMPNNKYESDFIDAETRAFEQKKGIWSIDYFKRDHRHHH
jgi:micrococcal nuclease